MPISRDTDGDPANLTWWKTPEHQSHSYAFEQQWSKFFRENLNPTRERVIQEVDRIAESFKEMGCGVLPE